MMSVLPVRLWCYKCLALRRKRRTATRVRCRGSGVGSRLDRRRDLRPTGRQTAAQGHLLIRGRSRGQYVRLRRTSRQSHWSTRTCWLAHRSAADVVPTVHIDNQGQEQWIVFTGRQHSLLCRAMFPSYSWVLAKRPAGWLVGGKTCVSVCLSALRLAISRQRVVRSTSSLACGRGPPGPRMCAVRSMAGVPRQRREHNPRRKHARRGAPAPSVKCCTSWQCTQL